MQCFIQGIVAVGYSPPYIYYILLVQYMYIYSKAQEPQLSAYNGHNLNSGCVFLEILSKGMYSFM